MAAARPAVREPAVYPGGAHVFNACPMRSGARANAQADLLQAAVAEALPVYQRAAAR